MTIRKRQLLLISGLTASFATLALAVLFIAQAHAESLGFSLGGATLGSTQQIQVTVLDDNTLQPVTDATVTLSNSLDSERASFTAETTTDTQGWLVLPSLGGETQPATQTVTVSKAGYSSFTLIGVQTSELTVYLKPLLVSAPGASATAIATGVISNFAVTDPSDNIQGGLVFKAPSAMDLLDFDASSFLSPLKDTINAFGSHQIPSNFVLPEQSVSYLFMPIDLNKPQYRLPVETGKSLVLAGLECEIATSDVVGGIDVTILNKVTFEHVGISGSFVPTGDMTLDVPSDQDLAQRYTVNVDAPPFAADVMVAAITDINGDRSVLVPTDAKLVVSESDPTTVNPGSLQSFSSNLGKSHAVVTAAVSSDHRITGIYTDSAGANVSPGDYLSIDAEPNSTALPASVTLSAPQTGVGAVIFNAKDATGAVPVTYPIGYAYVLPAAGQATFPTKALGTAGSQVSSYSVVQLDFGGSFNPSSIDGTHAMMGLVRYARAQSQIGAPQPSNQATDPTP